MAHHWQSKGQQKSSGVEDLVLISKVGDPPPISACLPANTTMLNLPDDA